MKPPQSRSSVIRWHQDWAFFPYTNDSLVTICIAIDDSTRENGITASTFLRNCKDLFFFNCLAQEIFILPPPHRRGLEIPKGRESLKLNFLSRGCNLHSASCIRCIHPAPFILLLQPAPFILQAAPFIQHPVSGAPHPAPWIQTAPCILHPAPYILHPAYCTLHPPPCNLHTAPYILHPATYILQPEL